jgi:hypothetical protein
MAASQLMNRTISRAHYERLHQGLKTAADGWHWRIVEATNPGDPSVITLQDLGLEPYVAPPLPTPEQPPVPPTLAQTRAQQDPERLPTLEEYVNAGYPVRNYGEFIERETAYRAARLKQAQEQQAEAERQRQETLAALGEPEPTKPDVWDSDD